MLAVGDKFEDLGMNRFNRTIICKRLREDLKVFKKEWLCEHSSDEKNCWKITVSKDGSLGILFKISRFPLSAVRDGLSLLDLAGNRNLRIFDVFQEDVFKKLQYIGNCYNYDNSVPMADDFDVNYYFHLEFDWRGTDISHDGFCTKMF
jgi:hypothetical protein